MKIISHRGNINGPNPGWENSPSYIDRAIALGFEVEIDLRCDDGQFFLGHDSPDHAITPEWLVHRCDKLWIHCKDLESCIVLATANAGFRFFSHSQDSFVMMSNGCIWVHDLSSDISGPCIIPLITKEQLARKDLYRPYGICTDFPTCI